MLPLADNIELLHWYLVTSVPGLHINGRKLMKRLERASVLSIQTRDNIQ